MAVRQLKEHMIFDFDTIKAQSQPPLTYPRSVTSKNEKSSIAEPKRPVHHHSQKAVTGPIKSLCLPRLHSLDDIRSALIVRHESPWDTYQQAISYDIAGEVVIASRRTRPSRVVAIRKYNRQDARSLIDRFGRLEHVNILLFYECYIDGDFAFFLVADLPLTLGDVVACSDLYPTEAELGSIMFQILEGMCYLAAFRLVHQSLVCSNILLGLDGIIKIAGPEHCVDCVTSQSEAACIAAIPSITMQLMQKYDKEDGAIGVDDLERWPIASAAVNFLSASGAAASMAVLKMHPLITARRRSAADLVLLARAALLMTRVNCTYHRGKNSF
ncbi:hypothetical protein N7466_001620 [Penicillium verhagenii]|uniref:uncharacterized protein n=1 Tax=Penicillium verhagenii TaxID=1562060 RepID=UPI0025453B8A|nr:uncharacterized protein N7466_001620 [Penicillium verhagenii]KAJ5938486.1 hypothetical protein N7466_001620 [Penicillium verhagenii]